VARLRGGERVCDRGYSAGELLVGLAAAQLAGEDHLIGLDRHRAEAVSQELIDLDTSSGPPTSSRIPTIDIAVTVGIDNPHSGIIMDEHCGGDRKQYSNNEGRQGYD